MLMHRPTYLRAETCDDQSGIDAYCCCTGYLATKLVL